jgi:hypothetical protein
MAIKDFRRADDGVTGIFFALGLMAIATTVGIAVDYSRHSGSRTALQSAADAAVLAAAALDTRPESERHTEAQRVFRAALARTPELAGAEGVLQINAGTYRFDTRATMPNIFGAFIGRPQEQIATQAQSRMAQRTPPVLSNRRVELAILLDNTASMGIWDCWDCTIDAMTSTLRDTSKALGADNLRVSYVPFGERVNIGAGRASWLTTNQVPNDWSGCVEPREEAINGNPHALTLARPSSAAERFVPTALSVLGHRPNKPHWFPNTVAPCPNEPMLVGTDDMDRVQQALRRTTTVGSGRHDEGMAWGGRVLAHSWSGLWGVPGYPRKEGDVEKVLLFVTDAKTATFDYEANSLGNDNWGHNTGSRQGFNSMVEICGRVRAAGITIHMALTPGVNPNFVPFAERCAGATNVHRLSNGMDLVKALRIAINGSADANAPRVGPRLTY